MYVIVAIIAYLFGSIPTGYLVAKRLFGIDIREFGSKNIGATNMFRTFGPKPALIVLFIDVAKGALPVLLTQIMLPENVFASLLAGALAVIGHNYTCWLNFKGGRGVATSLGVVVTLMPWGAFIVLVIWALVVYVTRYVSLASIIGAICAPIIAWHFGYDVKVQIFIAIMAFLVVVGHKDNIKRLLNGNENKIKPGSMDNIKR